MHTHTQMHLCLSWLWKSRTVRKLSVGPPNGFYSSNAYCFSGYEPSPILSQSGASQSMVHVSLNRVEECRGLTKAKGPTFLNPLWQLWNIHLFPLRFRNITGLKYKQLTSTTDAADLYGSSVIILRDLCLELSTDFICGIISKIICRCIKFCRQTERHMRYYWKVHGLDKKKNADLTYGIMAVTSFKIVSLRIYTAIPSFFTCYKSTVEVIFLNAVEYRSDVRHCFKTLSLQFHFQCGKQSKSIKASSTSRADEEQ
jgi:hypothetical protein